MEVSSNETGVQEIEEIQIDSDEDNEAEENKEEMTDSSSEGSENEEEIAARTAEIERAEKLVADNLYIYDPHVALIKLLKNDGDLEKLRAARERMSQIYPLTEELWLEWIQDEIKIAFTEEEKESVCSLFDRAVQDYLSVDLWLEYGQFSIGLMGMENGINRCRGVFERAITAAGLHVAKGCILWEAYREFELVILSTLQRQSDDVLKPQQQDEINQQTGRIINIFKRQLSIPLLDMQKSYEELKDFISDDIDPNIVAGYQKAFGKLSKLQVFEKKLAVSDPPHLVHYQEYIEFEKKGGEPARIQCLFERALVENCLVPDVWTQYVQYLDSQLKIETVVLPTYERALRNCPWSVTLWQGYLKALERFEQPRDKIKDTTEKALGAGFTTADEFRELWLAYLDYLRRQINWKEEHEDLLELLRATFERADTHLTEYFGYSGDPECTIMQYQARIEAKYCKNMEKARDIWNEIMKLGHAKHAHRWMEFINLERLYGDDKHLRKLFMRALQATSDWPESVGAAWLNFERDEGNLEQWDAAVAKYEARMKIIQQKRAKEAEASQQSEDQDKQQKSKTDAKGAKKLVKTTENIKVHAKRKFEHPVGGNESKVSPSKIKDKDGFAVPSVKPSSSQTVEGGRAFKKPKLEEKGFATKPTDRGKDERTVFLSNLSYEVDEDKIRDLFSKVGEITDVRLIKDFRSKSKGYGYVEFATFDLAIEALNKDREPLDGRPVFVSKCEEKTRGAAKAVFKYNTGLEKNKLFVKGLPFTMSKEDVAEMFKEFGDLKDVRLVTYRNGHSKGIAFVEYKDEATAAAAVLKTDGVSKGDHIISVAISNPPQRKDRSQAHDELSLMVNPNLGGGSRDLGGRGRGRTQISLMPRALRRMPAADAKGTADGMDSGSSQNGSDGASEAKPLSNSDFRSMLLKQ